MRFQLDKCDVLSVTKSRRKHYYRYTLHGLTLRSVNSTRDLGVTLTSDATEFGSCVKVEVAFRPNERYGFRGRKAILNRASTLVTICP